MVYIGNYQLVISYRTIKLIVPDCAILLLEVILTLRYNSGMR